jgi:hypothetical protein
MGEGMLRSALAKKLKNLGKLFSALPREIAH